MKKYSKNEILWHGVLSCVLVARINDKLEFWHSLQPGNDIDAYLRPLVDKLLQLWSDQGVRVCDEYKQEEFGLQALLFVTINNWSALSNISWQSNKWYNACTHCLDKTDSIYLVN